MCVSSSQTPLCTLLPPVPFLPSHNDPPMPMNSPDSADLLRVLLSVLLPPLGVFLQEGIGTQFWINVLLTLLGYIPGLVHAIWIIARR